MLDYDVLPSSGTIVPMLEEIRTWLRTQVRIPALEQDGDIWYLFPTTDRQTGARQFLDGCPPGRVMLGCAIIRLRPTHIQLGSRRDPITDQALKEFAEWCLSAFPCELHSDNGVISPEELIDPELYEF